MSDSAARRVFGLTLDDVLAQALDSAFSVEDADERADLVEQVAHSAVEHGSGGSRTFELAREVLIDLPERSVRALLHARLAEKLAREGDLTLARHHTAQAIAQTRLGDRWTPRTGWLTPDAARVALVRQLVTIGDLDDARHLLTEITPGSRHAARGRIALADPTDEQRWQDALDAVVSITDTADRRAALEGLVVLAATAGAVDRVDAIIDADHWKLDAVQRLVLVERAAEALAETGIFDAAGHHWARAIDLASLGTPTASTVSLCRIAETQARLVGQTPALATLRRAIRRVRDDVLPPDPGDAYPWRYIYRTVWANVTLAEPLRGVLRTRRSLAPAWCFVLGELEHASGQVERGRRAAAALEAAYHADPSDLEPMWLAALLYAHTHDLDHAIPAMRIVLAELPAGTRVRLPGDDDEAAYIETHFATALLRADSVSAAVDLARTAPHGELRAVVLFRAARAALRASDNAFAIDLCNEAGDSLAADIANPDPRSGRSLGVLPGEICRMLWSLGEHDAAQDIITDAIAATRALDGPLGVNLLCDLEARAVTARATPLVELLRKEGAQRIQGAAPAERCRLLLVVAEAAVTAPRRRQSQSSSSSS